MVFLPHNRNYRPKTCQCTKEPFLLPFPSVFLPHNRNYRPKTCQCTKEPFLLPFPSVFLPHNCNYRSGQKHVNAPKNPKLISHFMVRFPICFTRISKVGKCIAFQLWTPTYFFHSQFFGGKNAADALARFSYDF